jgi:hypothetical protein
MTSPNKKIDQDEIEDFEGIENSVEPSDESEVYESGKLKSVSIDELKGNVVAIKQLLNLYNTLQKKVKNQSEMLNSNNAEIEYLKTSPFVSILTTITNVLFVIINGIGINMTTEKTTTNHVGISLIVIGGLGILISNLWTILHPYARKFFNNSKK